MVVVGLVLLPETTRTIADRVRGFRDRQFVEAARELGIPDRSILWREIVWYNLRPLLLAQVARTFGFAILMEVTLSYFTLGHRRGTSWGSLLLEGKNWLGSGLGGPWMLVFPAAAIVLAVSGFRMIEAGISRRYGGRAET